MHLQVLNAAIPSKSTAKYRSSKLHMNIKVQLTAQTPGKLSQFLMSHLAFIVVSVIIFVAVIAAIAIAIVVAVVALATFATFATFACRAPFPIIIPISPFSCRKWSTFLAATDSALAFGSAIHTKLVDCTLWQNHCSPAVCSTRTKINKSISAFKTWTNYDQLLLTLTTFTITYSISHLCKSTTSRSIPSKNHRKFATRNVLSPSFSNCRSTLADNISRHVIGLTFLMICVAGRIAIKRH